jgi:HK97 family phage major capsid protein
MATELQERAVDNSAWDGASVMSDAAASDDPVAFYAAVCAGRRDGDPALQSSWALPHHKAPGDGPNADGVRNALSRLPQTDGLNNATAAQSHLDAHLNEIQQGRSADEPHLQELVIEEPALEMRSAAKRELDIRIVPWNTVIYGNFGPEMFERGAFAEIDPGKVRLKGPDARGNHEGPVVGKGIALQERDDAAYMTFKVSKTVHGDELLTLVADGVVEGASMSFFEVPGGTSIQQRAGQRLRVQKRVGLDHVVTTWRPAYAQSAVVQMRSQPEPVEVAPVSEQDPKAPETGAIDQEAITSAIATGFAAYQPNNEAMDKLTAAVQKLEERSRSEFVVPSAPPANKPKLHEWASVAGRMLMNNKVSVQELQERALQDVVSADNPGQIPEAFVNDLLGIVTPRRPFLASTTQIAAPAVGLSLTVPVFDTHSTVSTQSEEKGDIDSTAMKVTTATFDAITIAGGADVSIQMIRRGEPSFFDLLIRDLGAAYAASSDVEAIAALLGSDDGVTSGAGALDPENLEVGDAWANSISVIGTAPDRIWLSSTAVANFIDAKDNGTNRPLYFNLNSNFAAGTGTGGNVSALQPVYTPALDSSGVDVLIGPASGFAWAEDGTFQLQVDVPSKAGRDIAVVGILFFVPRYSLAFTSYSLAS